MAAIGQILLSGIQDNTLPVITTSATVGVDHTFDPEGFSLPGVVKWVDRSGGIAIGYPAITLSVRPPSKASRIYKVTAKVVVPTLEATSTSTSTGIEPPPIKAYDATCVMEWMLPERSSLLERQTLFSLVKTLLAATVNASDGVPTDATGSPLYDAVTNFAAPY